MYQFYVIEVQKLPDGTYAHLVSVEYDEDYERARLKGESKYFLTLSAAAISGLPEHSVLLMTSWCEPVYYNSYTHTT